MAKNILINYEVNDNHWIMKLRVQLIGYLIELANRNFKKNIDSINDSTYTNELIEDDDKHISEALQEFAKRYIFTQKDLQQTELTGHSVIRGLLDILLAYVTNDDIQYRNRIKNIISQNALKVSIHEGENKNSDLGYYRLFKSEDIFNYDLSKLSAYAKLRLVVDYLSGMTDKYAVDLYQRLSGVQFTKV